MKRIAERLHFELFLGLGLRGGGAITGFAFSWLIAHFFGARTTGLYQLALVTINLASIGAGLGLDRVLVRKVSVAFRQGEEGRALRLYTIACWRVLVAGLILSVLIVLVANALAGELLGEPAASIHLQILAPVLLLSAIIRLSAAMLRAKGKIFSSQSLDGLASSALASIILSLTLVLGFTGESRLPSAIYSFSTFIVMIFGLFLVRRMTKGYAPVNVTLDIMPGIHIATFNVITNFGSWVGIALLTSIEGAASTGVFRVASQYCLLFQLINSSFAVMVGPHFAKAAAEGDKDEILRILKASTKLGTVLSLPLLFALMILPQLALGLFGEQFVQGSSTLRIMAVGQFLNVLAGPVGAALTMCNQEKSVLHIQIFATAIAITMCVILIPSMGMVGAAFATTASSILTNAISFLALRRFLLKL